MMAKFSVITKDQASFEWWIKQPHFHDTETMLDYPACKAYPPAFK